MKPKVTIGVCVRNCEDFIKESIESIMNQDFPHELMELIFVDGGSEDRTLSIIQEYVSNIDIPTKIFYDSRKGLGHARNIVVANAKADFILWVDGDMILSSKDYFKKLVQFMEHHSEVGIAKGRQSLEPGGNLLATLETYSRAAGRMLPINPGKTHRRHLGAAGCIYLTKAIRHVGGFDEEMRGYGEDWDAEIRISKAGWKLYTIDVQYRDYERRVITWRGLWRRYLKRGSDMRQFLKKNKGMINFYKMLPPAAFLAGLLCSIKIYRLTRQKVSFLLPLQHALKMIAWCLGYIRSPLCSNMN